MTDTDFQTAIAHLTEMINLKFDHLDNRMTELLGKMDNEKNRVDRMEAKMNELDKELATMDTRLKTGWAAVLVVSSVIGFLINQLLK